MEVYVYCLIIALKNQLQQIDLANVRICSRDDKKIRGAIQCEKKSFEDNIYMEAYSFTQRKEKEKGKGNPRPQTIGKNLELKTQPSTKKRTGQKPHRRKVTKQGEKNSTAAVIRLFG